MSTCEQEYIYRNPTNAVSVNFSGTIIRCELPNAINCGAMATKSMVGRDMQILVFQPGLAVTNKYTTFSVGCSGTIGSTTRNALWPRLHFCVGFEAVRAPVYTFGWGLQSSSKRMRCLPGNGLRHNRGDVPRDLLQGVAQRASFHELASATHLSPERRKSDDFMTTFSMSSSTHGISAVAR